MEGGDVFVLDVYGETLKKNSNSDFKFQIQAAARIFLYLSTNRRDDICVFCETPAHWLRPNWTDCLGWPDLLAPTGLVGPI